VLGVDADRLAQARAQQVRGAAFAQRGVVQRRAARLFGERRQRAPGGVGAAHHQPAVAIDGAHRHEVNERVERAAVAVQVRVGDVIEAAEQQRTGLGGGGQHRIGGDRARRARSVQHRAGHTGAARQRLDQPARNDVGLRAGRRGDDDLQRLEVATAARSGRQARQAAPAASKLRWRRRAGCWGSCMVVLGSSQGKRSAKGHAVMLRADRAGGNRRP
jgi:hypothetical protein